MEKDTIQSTNRLLKVIVALLLRQGSEDMPTLRDQIKILAELGIKPTEIAEIIGRTSTYINKELSGIRKSQKQSK